MSIQIKTEKRKNPFDKDAEPLIYLSSVSRGRVEFEEILKAVCKDSTIDPNEATLGAVRLFDQAVEYLAMGFTVSFGKLGYFNVSIGSEGVTNEKDATADKVRRKRIVFYPGAKLRKAIQEARLEKIEYRIKR